MLLYNNMQKKCGFCKEIIPGDAGRCPYCGSVLKAAVEDNFEINKEKDETGKQSQAEPVGGGGEELVQNPEQNPAAGQDISGSINEGQRVPAETEAPYVTQMGTGQRTEQGYQYRYNPQPGYGRPPLSNGMKVFLTALFTLFPGIGQLAGIITAIVFMSSDGDSDRKSFGVALLVSCVVLFMLSCIGCFVFLIASQSLYR